MATTIPKDVDGYVVLQGKTWWVDREDTDTGAVIAQVGDTVMWVYNNKEYRGIVTNECKGRDGDVMRVDLIDF